MEFAYLILGWLFGLLSPLIVSRINRAYTKRELFDGIKTEIKECQFRTILIAYLLGARFGKYDREFLEWCLPYLEKYQGTESKEMTIKAIRGLLDLKDKDIRKVNELRRLEEKGRGLSLKKFHLPFLESKISEISCFKIELQNIIYEIISRVQLINEEIESAIRYFNMTFDSNVSDENQEIIRAELPQKYSNLQNQLIILAKKMDNCLSYKGKI